MQGRQAHYNCSHVVNFSTCVRHRQGGAPRSPDTAANASLQSECRERTRTLRAPCRSRELSNRVLHMAQAARPPRANAPARNGMPLYRPRRGLLPRSLGSTSEGCRFDAASSSGECPKPGARNPRLGWEQPQVAWPTPRQKWRHIAEGAQAKAAPSRHPGALAPERSEIALCRTNGGLNPNQCIAALCQANRDEKVCFPASCGATSFPVNPYFLAPPNMRCCFQTRRGSRSRTTRAPLARRSGGARAPIEGPT